MYLNVRSEYLKTDDEDNNDQEIEFLVEHKLLVMSGKQKEADDMDKLKQEEEDEREEEE